MVFTQHAGDLNLDHTITNRATLTAFRPLPNADIVSIYAYEVLSSTEYAHDTTVGSVFFPDTYVDISRYVETKIESLAVYEGEFQPDPHPRSREAVIHQTAMRGRQVGLKNAEAFMLLKKCHKGYYCLIKTPYII